MGGTFLSVLNQKNSSLKAEEKWDIYVQKCIKKGDATQIYELKTMIHNTKQKDLLVTTYCNTSKPQSRAKNSHKGNKKFRNIKAFQYEAVNALSIETPGFASTLNNLHSAKEQLVLLYKVMAKPELPFLHLCFCTIRRPAIVENVDSDSRRPMLLTQ
ncbi:hypothetical protein CK203_104288 [Vitis vinifera]|uniref:Uncharacterized protein n=1 Tax=Vitis vinifera TaxID=29760 RepID=A0A438EJI4_VITVI|nr:hypothetical protein CK203_104288 [Vitis vinifera]